MTLKIGTFNLNNLFSRFDFEADVATATTSTVMTRTSFTFADPSGFRERRYQGKLVKGKPGTAMVAKGGFANLSDAEVKSVVDLMIAKVK